MNRPYIICHMMASVDGRIDCDMTEKIESGDEYHEALDELDVPTTISGRVTAVMHYAEPGAFKPNDATPIREESAWKSVDADNYCVILDTNGTLLWESAYSDDQPLLCIVSEQVTREYLGYLKEKGISYIATGKERIDLPRAMEILHDTFGVKRTGVVGGGKINGAFLAAGLIDEMSLMIASGIDGRSNQPSVFDGIAENSEPVRLKLSHFKAYDCGTVWMRYMIV